MPKLLGHKAGEGTPRWNFRLPFRLMWDESGPETEVFYGNHLITECCTVILKFG